MHRFKILLLVISLFFTRTYGQSSDKMKEYFAEPIMMDTLSTLFIPILYDAKLFSSEKIAVFGNYYANILIYDFKVDQYRKLFPRDTFIEPIVLDNIEYSGKTWARGKNVSRDWVFYKVKSVDYTGNGKIDELDPTILFVSTRNGTGLKRLTPENEHVISIQFFESQGFALIRLLRDSDGDRSFRGMDKVTYYTKIDLKTLEVGHPIEIR